MVVKGEDVTASLTALGESVGRIEAVKADGSPVLAGTASVEPHGGDLRPAGEGGLPGELFIADQLSVGQRSAAPVTTSIDRGTANSDRYPFSLSQKLDVITEPSPWCDSDQNPWGRPILPIEMISVLTNKVGSDLPVRGLSVGLFLTSRSGCWVSPWSWARTMWSSARRRCGPERPHRVVMGADHRHRCRHR